jgi:DNA polymerase-1
MVLMMLTGSSWQEHRKEKSMAVTIGLPRVANKGEPVAIDIEMFQMEDGKLHRPTGFFACMSIAYSEDEVYVMKDTEHIEETLHCLRDGLWILQNAKFDLFHLRRYANFPRTFIWDTMLVDQVLFGGYHKYFALNDLAARWLNKYVSKDVRETFKTGSELTEEQLLYAGDDAIITLQVAMAQKDYINKNQLDMRSYYKVDAQVIWALLDMKPTRIDFDHWCRIADGAKERSAEVEKELNGLNPRSWQQVKKKLTELLGYTPKNTAQGTLEEIMHTSDVPEAITFCDKVIQTRKLSKASSTYGHNWIQYIEGENEIYPNYNINGAETGRFSCSSPNLQNIPSREMPEYREAIVPSEGCVLMVADVSQQEPRFLAYHSKDKKLLQAIHSGISTHLAVARELFGEDVQKDTTEYKHGKELNLGLGYGMQAPTLAAKIKQSVEVAQGFIDLYFKKFSGVHQYIRNNRKQAEKYGYVTTTIGRRLWVNPHNYKWKNNAINAPIQGGAAEQMKLAKVYLHQHHKEKGLPYCVCNMVHDELVLDVPKEVIHETGEFVVEAWKWAGEVLIPGIPMVVDLTVGDNWRHQVSIEEYLNE